MARPSRTKEAVEHVLDAIIDGRLEAGSALPAEGDLARSLSMSRLTMREAVRLLQAQGVIVPVPGSRHRIAPVEQWTGIEAVVRHARSAGERQRSSRELLEVRMMIESGAAQLAASRRTPEHLARLEDALGRMRSSHERDDVPEFIAADLDFHDAVLRAADNRILIAALLPLTTMLAETRDDTSSVPQIRAHALEEHSKIFAGIAEGDEERARDAMAGHLLQTRDDLETFVLAPKRAASTR